MKNLNTSIFILFLVTLSSFPFIGLEAKDNIPLEGQFEKDGARSVVPSQSVIVYLDGSQILIDFYQCLPEVTVIIKDSQDNIMYSRVLITPKSEVLLLENLNPGTYYLELRTTSGYMHGIFVVTGS